MKTVNIGELEIAYYEYGPLDGRPVILLHGFPYDARAYDDVAEYLALNKMLCFVPYLRGYGPTKFFNSDTFRSGNRQHLRRILSLLWMRFLSLKLY